MELSAALIKCIDHEVREAIRDIGLSEGERLEQLKQRNHKRDSVVIHALDRRAFGSVDGSHLAFDHPLIDPVLFRVCNHFLGHRSRPIDRIIPPYLIIPVPMRGLAGFILTDSDPRLIFVSESEVLTADIICSAGNGLHEALHWRAALLAVRYGISDAVLDEMRQDVKSGYDSFPKADALIDRWAQAQAEGRLEFITNNRELAHVASIFSYLALSHGSGRSLEQDIRSKVWSVYGAPKFRWHAWKKRRSIFLGYVASIISHELGHLIEEVVPTSPMKVGRNVTSPFAEQAFSEVGADSALFFLSPYSISVDRPTYYFGHLLFRWTRFLFSCVRVFLVLERAPTPFELWVCTYLVTPKKRVVPSLLLEYPSWAERYLGMVGEVACFEFARAVDAPAMWGKHLILMVAGTHFAETFWTSMTPDDQAAFSRSVFYEMSDVMVERLAELSSLAPHEINVLQQDFEEMQKEAEARRAAGTQSIQANEVSA
jgi:hypothetical protein